MFDFGDEADWSRARDVLAQADYTEEGIGGKLGRPFSLSVASVDLPPLLRRTGDLSPLNALIRLFLLGVPIPAQAVREALSPMPLEAWADAGLLTLEEADTRVAARVKLMPVGDLMLASDKPRRHTAPGSSDFVMPASVTTMELAHATIRNPSTRALDLGTGCGVLGLLAASHSEEVVATDLNPRAVAFAGFNARLNGIANIDCRTGSLYEPLTDERFDLIVSNPPFVISPTRRFLFRDAGMRGDEFCRELVRSVPSHLAEGGHCQLKANLAHRAGEDWKEGLNRWFEGLHCDVVVWVERVEAVSDYAITWIVGTESNDPNEIPDLYDQWMDYYEAQRIEAVSYLLITLRRTDQEHSWTLVDDAPRRIVGPCGADLLATFRLQDSWGTKVDEVAFLDTPIRLAPDIQIEQRHAMTSEGVNAVETKLCKMGGARFAARVEPHIAGLVARCDGTRSVGQLLSDMARALGEGEAFVTSPGIAMVRSLMMRGIVVPASPSVDPPR